MAIYLIRHGETQWALESRYTGHTDIPLTSIGEEQARGVGEKLKAITFDRVLCSPLLRARRTAELAEVHPPAEVNSNLSEFDYGSYEGMTGQEILFLRPFWNFWCDGCPGGESPGQGLRRACLVLEELAPKPDRNYALFAHGDILRAVAAAYLGVGIEFSRHLRLKVASISILGLEHEIPAIEAWNLG
jgi:probable phosphoglycerate mutase